MIFTQDENTKEDPYFALVSACIEDRFRKSYNNTETKKSVYRFADSKLVAMFADCSENFEPKKLSNLIKSTI